MDWDWFYNAADMYKETVYLGGYYIQYDSGLDYQGGAY